MEREIDWTAGACYGSEVAHAILFYENADERVYDRYAVERATSFCEECPIEADCLTFAMRTNQPYGVWGGMTPHQRRAIRKQSA